MPALIELNDLSKDYGSFRALSGVSLRIDEGITGLLGPNGAGKSTLIKVLLGLVKINSGHGHVLGFPIGQSVAQVRTQIGYMPEDDCYVHGLSGIESIQVAARLSGFSETEALRRGHEILDFCGMGQERYRPVETYSTGMRQKLRFAMAIVHDPKLLILDEPTSGLDPEEREAMLNKHRPDPLINVFPQRVRISIPARTAWYRPQFRDHRQTALQPEECLLELEGRGDGRLRPRNAPPGRSTQRCLRCGQTCLDGAPGRVHVTDNHVVLLYSKS